MILCAKCVLYRFTIIYLKKKTLVLWGHFVNSLLREGLNIVLDYSIAERTNIRHIFVIVKAQDYAKKKKKI